MSRLEQILQTVARRFRLPALADTVDPRADTAATALAIAIEQTRQSLARGQTPGDDLREQFTSALARLIRDALRPEGGDPAFQALLMRQQDEAVGEYAALVGAAPADRRHVCAAVNVVAHPAKPNPLRNPEALAALATLHRHAASSSWMALRDLVEQLLAMPYLRPHAALREGLSRLLDSPALARLARLEALASQPSVQRYQTLRDRYGPRAGSAAAMAQGVASRQRGAAVEASAAAAMRRLAAWLGDGTGVEHRIVTSLRVPAALPASHAHAKTEWDVALLRRADSAAGAVAWDLRLLVEAKASVDAAATDFSRLQRGLQLLGQADPEASYTFECREGTALLRGASLAALGAAPASATAPVLYCCDATTGTAPRLLAAASRMQLLSAPASRAYAARMREVRCDDPLAPGSAGTQALEAVWVDLLHSPRWRPVLNQYATLRQARDWMVHPDDLLAAVDAVAPVAAAAVTLRPPNAPPAGCRPGCHGPDEFPT